MREPTWLTKEEVNAGLRRLDSKERDTIAPIIGNIENQAEFRQQISETGRQHVQQILGKMFPNRNVTIQDFRSSLARRMFEKGYSRQEVKSLIHGPKHEEFGRENGEESRKKAGDSGEQ